MSIGLIIALVIIVVLVLWVILLFNSLVRLKNQVRTHSPRLTSSSSGVPT